ncbi:hypothetical protein G6F24_016097 [Rhizopus arrhizus]|nr:hypothetical protein G6F24_016097 [Rhizopus arrhizus]
MTGRLQRHFSVAAPQWPVAALTRQRDVGDAAGARWLRADPACMVPDMHGARMMAYGETLRPTLADCLALLPVLQPLFADAGFVLDAPDPSRWYLRLPIDLALPEFDNPDEVLGDDLCCCTIIPGTSSAWPRASSRSIRCGSGAVA